MAGYVDVPLLKVSLAELRARSIQLAGHEAIAVVLGVGRSLAWLKAPPPPVAIALRSDGGIEVQDIEDSQATAESYAQLLDALLPEPGSGAGPMPGGVRMLIARATGRTELPPIVDARTFGESLERFAPASVGDAIVSVMLRWAETTTDGSVRIARQADRRASGPTASELRGFLQEVDLERYVMRQRLALDRTAAPAPVHRQPVPLSSYAGIQESGALSGDRGRSRRMVAVVALLALAATAGVALGQRDHWNQWYDATLSAARSWTSRAEAPKTEAPPAAAEALGDTEVAIGSTGTVAEAAAARAPAAAHVRADDPLDAANVPRGLEPLRLASSALTSYSPSFGPAGSVFVHTDAASGTRLVKAETDRNGNVIAQATLVDNGAQNYHAQLSPDGRLLAFDSDEDGERGVYVANADGHNPRRVSGPGYAAVPRWSPDGRQLAFVRGQADRANVWNLWLLDLPSNSERQLTRYSMGQVWPGTWFSDGRRIAFTHEDTLFVLDTTTGGLRGYDSPIPGRILRTPAVAPDDRHVAFQVYRDGVWVLDTFTRRMRRVLADRSAEEFAWSPDGRRLAFHSRRSGRWGVWLLQVPPGEGE
jgi:hypothetical protein